MEKSIIFFLNFFLAISRYVIVHVIKTPSNIEEIVIFLRLWVLNNGRI